MTLLSSKIISQESTLSGLILDSQSIQPLENVLVYSSISNQSETSDSSGIFNFRLKNTKQDLVFSLFGYQTKILNPLEIDTTGYIVYLSPLNTMLQEVTVYSNSGDNKLNHTTSLSLKSDLITKISNAMPDVLRALQALPGVSTNNEFSAEYNVRGGNKDENLILLNGVEFNDAYHLKGAPNASIGVFHADLIEKVSLTSGGFSAKYGDRLSSVAAIKFREGDLENYKGSFTLSMAFVDGTLEGPLWKNASFIFGFRKTYMEYILDITDFGYEDIKTAQPSFYDIQGMLNYNLAKNSKLRLSFLHSGDRLKYNPISKTSFNEYKELVNDKIADIRTESFQYEDLNGSYYLSLIDLQNTTIIGNSAFLNISLSYTEQIDDESRIWGTKFTKDIFSDQEYFDNKVRDDITIIDLNTKTLSFQSSLDIQSTPFIHNKFGFSYKKLEYKDSFDYTKSAINTSNTLTYPEVLTEDYGYVGLDYRNDSLRVSSHKIAGFMESIFQIGNDLLVNLSGRIDYFDINKQTSLSPRLNMAYSIGDNTVLRGAVGKYYQSPIISQIAYSEPSDTNTKSQSAIHYVIGIEHDFKLAKDNSSELIIKLDAFYKNYRNLISSFFAHSDRLAYTRQNDAVGLAKGLDVYLALKLPFLYSWLSYSYLISEEDVINDEFGAYPRLSGQEHTLSWVTDFKLGKGWNINTKYYYGSGYPYAEKQLYYESETEEYFWRNQYTTTKFLPFYQRVDLRISKEYIFESLILKTFLEVSNLTNHKNVRGYEYNYDEIGNPEKYEITLWPILPSFGIRLEF